MHQREQKRTIGAGSDEVMLARQLHGLRPPWVDDDDLAATLHHILQAAGALVIVMRLRLEYERRVKTVLWAERIGEKVNVRDRACPELVS